MRPEETLHRVSGNNTGTQLRVERLGNTLQEKSVVKPVTVNTIHVPLNLYYAHHINQLPKY